ncbi:MAG: hypothetical protein WAV48_05050 [Candidatus Magasanikiibacteriota bacterium]
MCGIIGVVVKPHNGFTKRIEDSFYQLLFVNTLRGDDSTGIVAVETDTTFHIMKEAVEAAWFVPQLQYGTLGKSLWTSGKALIGHNRKATVGKTKDDTAHPFVVDEHFAMVHNGTLYQHEKLAKTEVDSEALAIVLAKAFEEADYKESLEALLPKVNGAYAVAMYDQRHHKVRLLRNKERPLAIVETPDAWFYASEGLMLHWILSRNGYTAKDMGSLRAVPEDTVFEFDLATNTLIEEKITVKKYTPHTTSTAVCGAGTGTKSSIYKKSPVSEGMSKNEYKRLRRQLLGTHIEWWADDYVEAHFPKTYEDGETVFNLMGDCENIQEDHVIHALIDVANLQMIPDKLCDRLWTGRVEEMTYNTKTKTLSVYVADASPLPISIKKTLAGGRTEKDLVIDAAYIQKALDEQEKALVTLL